MSRRQIEAGLRRAAGVARKGDVVFIEAKQPIHQKMRHAIMEHCSQILESTGIKVVLLSVPLSVKEIREDANVNAGKAG